jgi:hypothetical protein
MSPNAGVRATMDKAKNSGRMVIAIFKNADFKPGFRGLFVGQPLRVEI